MHPILADFGTHDLPLLGMTHLFIPTYGVLFAAGALFAWWWFVRRAVQAGLPKDPIYSVAFWALIGGLFGAKATLIAVDLHYYLDHPMEILGTIRSAGVLMGGILFGALAFILAVRHHRLPLFTLGDAIAAPLALAQAIGRLGCYSAGCCWGVPSDGWCAVRFTSTVAHDQTGVPLDTPLVPTQLIEFVFDLALAGLLTWMWRRRRKPAGTVFWVYLGLYSAGRALIEHWRGDAVRGLWLGASVSTSQLFAAIGIAIAVFFLVHDRRTAVERA